MFYTGPETLNRPAFLRYEKRFFERYQYPETEVMVAFEDGGKPYGRHYQQQIADVLETCDAHFFVASPDRPGAHRAGRDVPHRPVPVPEHPRTWRPRSG